MNDNWKNVMIRAAIYAVTSALINAGSLGLMNEPLAQALAGVLRVFGGQ